MRVTVPNLLPLSARWRSSLPRRITVRSRTSPYASHASVHTGYGPPEAYAASPDASAPLTRCLCSSHTPHCVFHHPPVPLLLHSVARLYVALHLVEASARVGESV